MQRLEVSTYKIKGWELSPKGIVPLTPSKIASQIYLEVDKFIYLIKGMVITEFNIPEGNRTCNHLGF